MKPFKYLLIVGAGFALTTALQAETPELKENSTGLIETVDIHSQFSIESSVSNFDFKVTCFADDFPEIPVQNSVETKSVALPQKQILSSVHNSNFVRKARDGLSKK